MLPPLKAGGSASDKRSMAIRSEAVTGGHPGNRRGGALSRHWPPAAALGVLWVVVAALFWGCLRRNQGQFCYLLDDAFIHMAVARNLAVFGVFGVTRDGFSNAESTILWPLLLALADRVLGVSLYTPFVLNLVFGSLAVVVADGLLRTWPATPPPPAGRFLALLAVIFCCPMPFLIFSGMEHLLQFLVTMAFVAAAAHAATGGIDRRKEIWALSLAPLVTMVRYEGLFCLSAACVLLALRRRTSLAAAVGALGVLPVVLFGWLSSRQGGFWLPTSVILKSSLAHEGPPRLSLGYLQSHALSGLSQIVSIPEVLFLFTVLLGMLALRIGLRRDSHDGIQMLILLYLLTTLVHAQFALLQGFFRYDAYLVGLGLLILFLALFDMLADLRAGRTGRQRLLLGALAVCLFASWSVFQPRSAGSLNSIPVAVNNIWSQQYQMGRFVHEYYDGQAVALNDIGAVNYLSDIHCVDLFGLSSADVARAKIAGRFGTGYVSRLAAARHLQIAIVYDSWVSDALPAQWVRVRRWRIPNNDICGSNTVSFYATRPGAVGPLVAHLKAFAPCLPGYVTQIGMNTPPR